MPTVLRVDGFAVRILTDDHPPPHVHVVKAGEKCKIEIGTLIVSHVIGMRASDLVRALEIVEEHRWFLWQRWRQIHYGQNSDSR
ncbi:MAG TPA: DUF4160 domain-containing protein [Longimicrobiaceae bacterium]|nr:DUF4160 domain-containing protein [Longimicrobiaceae bacterium]